MSEIDDAIDLENFVEHENIHVVKSLGEVVAPIWAKQQEQYTKDDGLFYVSSPLSSTPLPLYKKLIEDAPSIPNWERMRFVLMDEQVEGDKPPFSYISLNDPASYEQFARRHFLEPLGQKVRLANDVLMKPDLSDLERFNATIVDHNGIDLLILAIGVKGNYANVMPDTEISSEEALQKGWHVTHLISEFRQIHTQGGSQSFAGAQFREYGMSLGPKQVIDAKKVIVIVSGKKKSNLAKELLSRNAFKADFPLSVIHHPMVKDKIQIFLTEDVIK